MTTTILGKRIRIRLVQRGLTQKDLAEGVGVSQPQISRLIRGDRGTDLETVKQIAIYLKDNPYVYILMYANLSIGKFIDELREKNITKAEQLLNGLIDEKEDEMSERWTEVISPPKKGKTGKPKHENL